MTTWEAAEPGQGSTEGLASPSLEQVIKKKVIKICPLPEMSRRAVPERRWEAPSQLPRATKREAGFRCSLGLKPVSNWSRDTGEEMEINTEHGGEQGMLHTDTLAWQSTIQPKSHTWIQIKLCHSDKGNEYGL